MDSFNKLGSAISLIERAKEQKNIAMIKSNKLPLSINKLKYKQFNIFPNMTLFFLPKKSMTTLAGICKNIPKIDLIEVNNTTFAALICFICVKNRKSMV